MRNLGVLLLGDIVGQPGCRALFFNLPKLRQRFNADLVIVNGENASDGFGIMPEMAEKFFSSGVDVITTGNHIWQKKEVFSLLNLEQRILRPMNYPSSDTPGHGFCIVESKGGPVAVMNLQGRKRMGLYLDCPFRSARKNLGKIHAKTKVVIVDFHAECPQEKEALAFYLDGQVSAVIGTHSHIQTMDEKILPGGTGYLTDAGMTGPVGSVIGAVPDISVRRSMTQMPLKVEISENDALIQGVFMEIDPATGKTMKIERVSG
jgi:metallophosphoesterase (TIGR00282 family)